MPSETGMSSRVLQDHDAPLGGTCPEWVKTCSVGEGNGSHGLN